MKKSLFFIRNTDLEKKVDFLILLGNSVFPTGVSWLPDCHWTHSIGQNLFSFTFLHRCVCFQHVDTYFTFKSFFFQHTVVKLPSLPPNIGDISAYAVFAQILSFILLTWEQNFWLILILLNPVRDKNTNLDINYKAFLPYNNHWDYIAKNWFWPFFNWQLCVSNFYGQEWNSILRLISLSS